MYIRGIVSSTIHLAVGSATIMEGQQPQPVQDLDQVLGRIQDIMCTQLNAFKREIRVNQEEAPSRYVKKVKARTSWYLTRSQTR